MVSSGKVMCLFGNDVCLFWNDVFLFGWFCTGIIRVWSDMMCVFFGNYILCFYSETMCFCSVCSFREWSDFGRKCYASGRK